MDTVERVNADAPINLLVDPIRERLRTNGSVDLLALALAAWLRRVRGVDDAGRAVDVHHPLAPLLREKAVEGGADRGRFWGSRACSANCGTTTAWSLV